VGDQLAERFGRGYATAKRIGKDMATFFIIAG
jgi:hypothetical protein